MIAAGVGEVAIAIRNTAAEAAADFARSFAAHAEHAVAERGRFCVALAGGSAPRAAYALLARDPLRSAVAWEHVHVFWGDERCVPPGHERSNFRMAHDAFLRDVPIPAGNVHRMRGELPREPGAEAYAGTLHRFFDGGDPVFDLLHLGVGTDGHTASLFPFSAALRERERPVISAIHVPLGEGRISLTLPVVNAGRAIEFLVVGNDKAAVARKILVGPRDPFLLPAQGVRPMDGSVRWILDSAAAAALDPDQDVLRTSAHVQARASQRLRGSQLRKQSSKDSER